MVKLTFLDLLFILGPIIGYIALFLSLVVLLILELKHDIITDSVKRTKQWK